jgi:hypothetical protein
LEGEEECQTLGWKTWRWPVDLEAIELGIR